ncbi:MAG: hypothetical protein ACI9FG_000599 [Crocinitomicaceae bacterium]|jgi:hypothetical protein
MRYAESLSAGHFLINRRLSSVMVLGPLPRLALMDQKITPALVSFDSLSGISLLPSLVILVSEHAHEDSAEYATNGKCV